MTSSTDSPDLKSGLSALISALSAEREAHLARVERIDLELDAARVLLGADASSSTPEPEPEDASPKTWGAAIRVALDGVNGGLRPKDITARLPERWRERSRQTPNSIYNALAKLERTGEVARKGQLVYLTSTLEKIERGEIEEVKSAESVDETGVPALILGVLTRFPHGLNARGIIKMLRESEEGRERLDRNPQVAYAALSRMAQSATIVRVGKLYHLPEQHGVKRPSLFETEGPVH